MSLLLAALGGGGAMQRCLVAPGFLSPLIAFSRSQPAGARVAALAADDVTWLDFAADVPRFHGAARRLLTAGARSNLLRNPDALGAVPGVIGGAGALPGTWSHSVAAGHTATVIGTPTMNGRQGVEIELASASVAGTTTIWLEAANQVPLSPSTTYGIAVLARRTGGDFANVSSCGIRGRADATTASNGALASLTGVPTDRLGRVAGTYLTPADAVNGRLAFIWITTAGGPASTRLVLAAPQMEVGLFASNPILPAAASQAVSQHGAELLSCAAAALFPGGAGTILWSGVLPAAPASGGEHTVFQLDDGTANNALVLRRDPAGMRAWRFTGGASAQVTGGTVTAGAITRVAASFAGGRMALSVNGAAALAVTGGPASGLLTTARIGAGVAGALPSHAEHAFLAVRPHAAADAALPALCAALPG